MTTKKILVIDEDSDSCNLISEALAAEGITVETLAETERAVEKAEETAPDLICIGFNLRDSNGLQVSSLIHSRDSLKSIPIILMISEEFDTRYSEIYGVVNVLAKPLNKEKVVSRTIEVLKKTMSIPEKEGTVNLSSLVTRGEYDTLEQEMGKLFSSKEDYGEEDISDIPLEGEEGYADRLSGDESGESDQQSSDRRVRKRRRNLSLAYSVTAVVILLAAAIFIMTDRQKEPDDSGGTAFDKEMPERVETVTEAIPEEVRVIPPLTVEELEEEIPSVSSESSVRDRPVVSKEMTEQEDNMPEQPSLPEKKEPEERVYALQAGVFLVEENALSLTDNLKRKGYDAYIVKVQRPDGKIIHRVLIGKYKTEKKALERSGIFREKENIRSFVYHY